MRVRDRFGRLSLVLVAATAAVTSAAAFSATGRSAPGAVQPTTSCQLGHGVSHVVQITFDNVHFFRDNPNVPSDLEQMPHLLNFIQSNGTMLSNNHTPLIAHTATDSLTNYTGLYGDRHGIPVSNSFRTFNPDGTTDPGVSFAYWTAPVFDPAPSPGHDTTPEMVYSPTVPATSTPPNTITPAPWVPYTRAGCNVGDVSTANMVLENAGVDIPTVFGPTSPEAAQLAADHTSSKNSETADYVGVGVHCAQGDSFCATAQGPRGNQMTPSPTATPDLLPTEPGGYNNFSALFGHRYLAPQLGGGTPSVSHNGYLVTNSFGNLVDLDGHQINGPFLTNHPGFPGFTDISASQSLAYMSDLQETGVPVTFGYISDLHGNHHYPGLASCASAPDALGPGDPCYIAQAKAFDRAFNVFFTRLAAAGITPANTLFTFTADEGDHLPGANVGRALQPSPANCDGVTVPCTYAPGTLGELSTNVTGLLATEKGNTTPFKLHSDSAPQFYVTGNPGPASPVVRQLEHDVAGLTASNPYSGNANEPITNYLADPLEERILHIVNADPARTPTFSSFSRPDYFLSPGAPNCTSACVKVDPGFAYNHGDYAPEINTTWLGMVGPGVANKGVDGLGPAQGPSSAGPNSGQGTIPGSGTTGTWADHTDIRPTMLYLVGLRDDFLSDGRVLTEDLTNVGVNLAGSAMTRLGQSYKQLNASVGRFGTDTLIAATHGIESAGFHDIGYTVMVRLLSSLATQRDALAAQIKTVLDQAEFAGRPISSGTAYSLTARSEALQSLAHTYSQLRLP